MKKIISIVGARPQIIKSSALNRAIQGPYADQLQEIIVHTGQHYDENMSNVFFDEMKIAQPDYNLQAGKGSHAEQTARMLEGIEKIIIDEQPTAVLVYGDTNSTLAGGLAAAKMGVPVIHVEAGLRSFNKAMPEEINRISCDHVSTLLFTPTGVGVENLRREGFDTSFNGTAGIDSPKVYHCGDVMYDNSLHFSSVSLEKTSILQDLGIESNGFILMTVHRPSNTDHPDHLAGIFLSAIEMAEQFNLDAVVPLHPRTRNRIADLPDDVQHKINESSRLRIIEPVGYLDVIALEKSARIVMTDSGGLQKEAYFFKKPCVILREQTEWVELVENGNAILTGPTPNRIKDAFVTLMERNDYTYPEYYGDGKAAEFICQKILEDL